MTLGPRTYHSGDISKVCTKKNLEKKLKILCWLWLAVEPTFIMIEKNQKHPTKLEVIGFPKVYSKCPYDNFIHMKIKFKKKGGFWPDLPHGRTYPTWPYMIKKIFLKKWKIWFLFNSVVDPDPKSKVHFGSFLNPGYK